MCNRAPETNRDRDKRRELRVAVPRAPRRTVDVRSPFWERTHPTASGKPVSGAEVKEAAEKGCAGSGSSQRTCALSRRRTWTSG